MERHRPPLRSASAPTISTDVPRSKSTTKVRQVPVPGVSGHSNSKENSGIGDAPTRSTSTSRSHSANKVRHATIGGLSKDKRDGDAPPPLSGVPAAVVPRSQSASKVRLASTAALGNGSKEKSEGLFNPSNKPYPSIKGPPPLSGVPAAVIPRSQSASKVRLASTAALGHPSKEKSEGLFNPSNKPYPSTRPHGPLFPARSPLLPSAAPLDAGGKHKTGGTSAWARSPGRSPPQPAVAGGRRGIFGTLGGLVRGRSEPSSVEEEKHQMRLLTPRLLQWRFANAYVVAGMEAARRDAQEKLLHAWLKNYELRNLVAAKKILIRRQTHRLWIARFLEPQLQILNQWEPHAKRHFEAVAILGRLLATVCIFLPLAEGSQANVVSVGQSISSALNTIHDIVDSSGMLYSMAENIDSILNELLKTVHMEMEGFKELVEMFERNSISRFDTGSMPQTRTVNSS